MDMEISYAEIALEEREAPLDMGANGSPDDRHTIPVHLENVGSVWKRHSFQEDDWCCERGLNSRPLPYQGSALPLSYRSNLLSAADFCHIIT